MLIQPKYIENQGDVMRFKTGFIYFVSLIIIVVAGCNQDQQQAGSLKETASQPKARQSEAKRGEPLFRQLCSSCHPDGGNVTDPKNNLRRATLKAKRINKPEDIVAVMRKPGPRMIRFDSSTVSDADALAIADYILENF
jgi:cytochrome c6